MSSGERREADDRRAAAPWGGGLQSAAGNRTDGGEERDELARLGAAFADPSRRELYRKVVESPYPLSAGELADFCGLHRTVARAHLQKLVEAGLLSVSLRHSGRGGRPPKVFSPAGDGAQLSLPPRRYDWLARGLLSVLPRVAADKEALLSTLEEAGVEEGRRAMPGSVAGAVEWLNERGYQASLSVEDGQSILCLGNCVVAELAAVAPSMVCSFDRGLICGLFGLPGGGIDELASLAVGDDECRLRLGRLH